MNIDKTLKITLVILLTTFLAFAINYTLGKSHAANTLKTPTSLKTLKIYKTSVELSWDKVDNADGYELQMHNKGTGKTYVTNYSGRDKISVLRSKMIEGNSYIFKIRAYQLNNSKKYYSAYSNGINVTTKYIYPPTTLKLDKKTKTSIKVSWSKVTDAQGYILYVYDVAKDKQILKKTINSASTTTYTKTSLDQNTDYSFRVEAFKKKNGQLRYSDKTPLLKVRTDAQNATKDDLNNEYDNTNSFNTNEVTSEHPNPSKPNTSQLVSPSNLKISATTKSTITLTWDKVNAVNGYEFYVKNYKTDEIKTHKIIGSNINTITLTDFIGGEQYILYLKAYKEENNKITYSGNSNGIKISVKKPTATNNAINNNNNTTSSSDKNVEKVTLSIPKSFKITKIDYTSISLDWAANDASGYYVKMYNHDTKETKTLTFKTSSANITGLKKGTTYTFNVSSYKTIKDKTYTSKYSEPVEATTKNDESYKDWKQCDKPWGSYSLGSSTICKIGCAATSVAILVKDSGVDTNISNFNPGTYVNAMKKKGGFTAGGSIYWDNTKKIAPNFVLEGDTKLSGTKTDKAKKLKSLLNKGYYITMQVKQGCGRGSHFVAIDHVEDSTIYMNDPASEKKIVTSKYSSNCWNRILYFKKKN